MNELKNIKNRHIIKEIQIKIYFSINNNRYSEMNKKTLNIFQ